MYNSYTNGSEPWWAMKEALEVHQSLEEAVDSVADAFERIIDDFDTACGERNDLQAELDQSETEKDELQKKVDAMVDPNEVIDLLDSLERAAAGIVKYAVTSRMKIRRQFDEVADFDDPVGGPGDGSSETPADQTDSSEGSEG